MVLPLGAPTAAVGWGVWWRLSWVRAGRETGMGEGGARPRTKEGGANEFLNSILLRQTATVALQSDQLPLAAAGVLIARKALQSHPPPVAEFRPIVRYPFSLLYV
jgi:hypothetical protein